MLKKGILVVAAFLLVFICTACGSGMRLEPIQLTDADRQNPELIQDHLMPDSIYSYQASDALKSLHVTLYQLDSDGKWQNYGGSSTAVETPNGRIVLFLPFDHNNFRFIVENGDPSADHISSSYTSTADNFPIVSTASQFTSAWKEPCDITYGKAIPICVLSVTDESEPSPYGIENFDNPPKPKETDTVYAVTVKFSEDSLG